MPPRDRHGCLPLRGAHPSGGWQPDGARQTAGPRYTERIYRQVGVYGRAWHGRQRAKSWLCALQGLLRQQVSSRSCRSARVRRCPMSAELSMPAALPSAASALRPEPPQSCAARSPRRQSSPTISPSAAGSSSTSRRSSPSRTSTFMIATRRPSLIGYCDGVAAGTVRLFALDQADGIWQGDRLAVLAALPNARAGRPLVRCAVATAAVLGGRLMSAHPARECAVLPTTGGRPAATARSTRASCTSP